MSHFEFKNLFSYVVNISEVMKADGHDENIPLIIRSFHRQLLEPTGCVMSSDLPWMSEPSPVALITLVDQ